MDNSNDNRRVVADDDDSQKKRKLPSVSSAAATAADYDNDNNNDDDDDDPCLKLIADDYDASSSIPPASNDAILPAKDPNQRQRWMATKQRVSRSEELFQKKEYGDAVLESTRVLETVPPLCMIAKAALIRGRALLHDAEIQQQQQQDEVEVEEEEKEAGTKTNDTNKRNRINKDEDTDTAAVDNDIDDNDNAEKEEMEEVVEERAQQHSLQLRTIYEKAWNAFGLSNRLNPDCEETMDELDNVSKLLGDLRSLPRPKNPLSSFDVMKNIQAVDYDVIVVGAGAAGIGCGLMLTKTFGVDKCRVLLVERGDVGETFHRWPEEMRFISPSFNQQGWTDSFDLNSIAHGSSPAFSLHSEHPSGKEYAAYLAAIAKMNGLQIRRHTEVTSIRPIGGGRGEGGTNNDTNDDMEDDDNYDDNDDDLPLFSVDVQSTSTSTVNGSSNNEKTEVNNETLTARYIVWAAGEFQYPQAPRTTSTLAPTTTATTMTAEEEEKKQEDTTSTDTNGEELCMHNSQVRSWADLPGNDFVIIGGYESGIDACVNLSRAGKRCKVLASTPCWNIKTSDPSLELAPYTAGRLRDVLLPTPKSSSNNDSLPRPELCAPLRVIHVRKLSEESGGGFEVTARWESPPKDEDDDDDDDDDDNDINDDNIVDKDETIQNKNSPTTLRDLSKAISPAEVKPGKEGSILILHTPQAPILCTGKYRAKSYIH